LFDQRLNPYFAKLAHYFENPQSWNAAQRRSGWVTKEDWHREGIRC